MKTLKISLLVTIAVSFSTAQEIHFCLSYTVLGEPMRVSNSWNINEDGGYLYILYKQTGAIECNKYDMVVSEEREGKFAEVSRYGITPDSGSNWVAVYHKFFKGGDFRVTVQEKERIVATEYLTIIDRKTRILGKKKFKHDPRFVYADTKVVACETVKEGKPVNPSAVFSITENTSQVTFLILNDKGLNTAKLNIDLYKKVTPFGEYSEFVESKRVELMRDQDNTYFTLQFIEPGEYKVYIYDQDQVWINSGYVTINSEYPFKTRFLLTRLHIIS
jgi:hypothetical protein